MPPAIKDTHWEAFPGLKDILCSHIDLTHSRGSQVLYAFGMWSPECRSVAQQDTVWQRKLANLSVLLPGLEAAS